MRRSSARARRARGIECIVGRAERGSIRRTEAAWRDARWRFLREVAADARRTRRDGAHRRRSGRNGSDARVARRRCARTGRAARARADVLRPLLHLRRDCARRIRDRTGNRVGRRSDERVARVPAKSGSPRPAAGASPRNPRIDEELGSRARVPLRGGAKPTPWRTSYRKVGPGGPRRWTIGVAGIRGLDAEQLAVLWPAIAARVGVTLDRPRDRRVSSFSRDRASARGFSSRAAGRSFARVTRYVCSRPPGLADTPRRPKPFWTCRPRRPGEAGRFGRHSAKFGIFDAAGQSEWDARLPDGPASAGAGVATRRPAIAGWTGRRDERSSGS